MARKRKTIKKTEAELEWERGAAERLENLQRLAREGWEELGMSVPDDNLARLRELYEKRRAATNDQR